MEEYIVSVHNLFYNKKQLLPGNGCDEQYLVYRLQAGATIILEFKEELAKFSESFILANQYITKQEKKLLNVINCEAVIMFIHSL